MTKTIQQLRDEIHDHIPHAHQSVLYGILDIIEQEAAEVVHFGAPDDLQPVCGAKVGEWDSHRKNVTCPACLSAMNAPPQPAARTPSDVADEVCRWLESNVGQFHAMGRLHTKVRDSIKDYVAALRAEMAQKDREANEEIEKLRAFKAYVHKRLDDAGVPVDPESPHKAEGCRIGGRLDIVLDVFGLIAKGTK